MKKIILSMFCLLFLGGVANAQFITKKNNEVKPLSYDYRYDADGYSFTYLADGNKGRAAINFGQGVALDSVVKYLPSELAKFRLVPMLTLDGSKDGSDPRATLALLTPDYRVAKWADVKFGVALNGASVNDSLRSVHGVSGVVSIKLFLNEGLFRF